mgnify:CR=1 FL=1|tara:strand:+ start:546661 stop:550890 length:4230 start_codon:yes stop_codon:yes gene_type:complete
MLSVVATSNTRVPDAETSQVSFPSTFEFQVSSAKHDIPLQDNAIRVWVDVGGTFTDCFVNVGGQRRCLKVLSSGVTRAEVTRVLSADRFHVQFSHADQHSASTEDFWRGADVSLIHDGQSVSAIGRIERQSVDEAIKDSVTSGGATTGGEITVREIASSEIDGLGITDRANRDATVAPRVAASVNSLHPGAIIQLDPHLEAPVLATRLLLGIPLSQPLPPLDVRLGTTRGTNALLTRSGATTALVTTQGFADVLNIGQQDRPDLFALNIKKPASLAAHVVEVDERLDASGKVLRPINTKHLKAELRRLRDLGVQSLAICLLHAYVNDEHERIAANLAREVGFDDVSCSHEVAPLIKLVSRAETTTLDAYLNPVLRGYVDRVWQQFGGHDACRLRLMTSNGNLVSPDAFRGRDSILSGPAGGVVALAHVARSAGADAAIGLDMGGTSTDVSRFEGSVGRRSESRVSGVRVMTTTMDIQTVAAGGGSVCDIVDGRMIVGPRSAGADPGPACYGRGGPLTVTDVNLLLGRLPAERFPFPLDVAAARQRLADCAAYSSNAGSKPSEHADVDLDLAEGFLQIAVTHMAEAVRAISTAQGSDVRKMTLVGFGGAAGAHLCRVAEALQMERILDHPDASVLSALGMGLADVGRVVTQGVYHRIDEKLPVVIESIANELQRDATQQLAEESAGNIDPVFRWQCEVRFAGTDAGLDLALYPVETLQSRFCDKHRATFGYVRENRECELVSIECEAKLASDAAIAPRSNAGQRKVDQHDVTHDNVVGNRRDASQHATTSPVRTRFWYDGKWVQAESTDRASLHPGDAITGPAMIASDQSTLVVEPGWRGDVLADRTIQLCPTAQALPNRDLQHRVMQTRDAQTLDAQTLDALADEQPPIEPTTTAQQDPVLLEVVARRLQGIADAMGEVLRRTAVSVNVKERRDYSCAVFRGDGSLIANAPHVPVHLGAMGHTVRHMIDHFGEMSPGDCYLSNDPFAGGSHLPDITVVTPVFCSGHGAKPDFFVASRAHHAEIGGRTPGSMPPDATSLAEEGVVLRQFALVNNGISHEQDLRELLSAGRYPSRTPAENLADIAAQQAAGVYGASALTELAGSYTVKTIDALMGRLLDVAGQGVANWIKTLPATPMCFQDALDDGSPISVRLQRQDSRLVIDFAGTAPVHPGGFNATPSIVTAAVLYVLRCVSGSDLPLCDGVLRQIDLDIPIGMLNPPSHADPSQCAAVVAGNVETSQRIVDVLLGALGVAAASQGTMNNLLIGDNTFGYYETIGGGSGATPDADGADAVHTHMTNTLITDPEVMESRLPVRLHRFAIRRGSGGAGVHRGGDGIIREIEFLKPLTISLITGRRTRPPYGAAGGNPGMCGRNLWIHQGEISELSPSVTFDAQATDRLIIQTPGGGGWGKK